MSEVNGEKGDNGNRQLLLESGEGPQSLDGQFENGEIDFPIVGITEVVEGGASKLIEVASRVVEPVEDPKFDALIRSLKSGDLFAARALGSRRDPRALKALIAALRYDDELVCKTVASVLGEIGDRLAVPALIEALGCNKGAWVRHNAASALEQIGDARAFSPLVEALKDEHAAVRRSAALALGKIGDNRAVPALIEVLKEECWEVRGYAAEALGKIGDDRAVPALIGVLKDEHAAVRRSAVLALEKIGDERAVPALIEALTDEDEEVRRSTVLALGKIGDERAVPALIEALKDEHAAVREIVVLALGKIGDERAVPALIEVLNDENANVYWRAAIRALGKLGDARAVPALIEILKSEDWRLRKVAAEALGEIGSTEAIGVLFEVAKNDTEEDVRNVAVYSLGEIGEKFINDQFQAISEEKSPFEEVVAGISRELWDLLFADGSRVEKIIKLIESSVSLKKDSKDQGNVWDFNKAALFLRHLREFRESEMASSESGKKVLMLMEGMGKFILKLEEVCENFERQKEALEGGLF